MEIYIFTLAGNTDFTKILINSEVFQQGTIHLRRILSRIFFKSWEYNVYTQILMNLRKQVLIVFDYSYLY